MSTHDQLQIIAAVAAFGVLVFFCGIAAWYTRRGQLIRLREHVQAHVGARGPKGQVVARTQDFPDLASRMNKRLVASGMSQQLQVQLIRSGLSLTPNQFMMTQVAAGCLLFMVTNILLSGELGPLAMLAGILATLPAIFLPRFILKWLEGRRVRRFELQLAQAVDIMAGALQSGSSLPQSFGLVAREMPDPIGSEFGRLIHEMNFGIPLEQTLINMLDRVPSVDLDMLVSAINIQYKVGGNLSHILKTIAHTIRERVRIRGELSTLTAQARLSSYIIAGMPIVVVLALFVISPAYIIKLFDPGITRLMLIAGIMGIVGGFYVMKRIATIEV